MNPLDHPPPPLASFEALFRAYAAELPRWFVRLRVPSCDTSDAAQAVWLELHEHPEQVPTSPREARRSLFKVAARVAQRLRRRAARAANRQHPATEPDDLATSGSLEERANAAFVLFEILNEMAEPHKSLLFDHKILGYTAAELAAKLGDSEAAMSKRLWRASAELTKKLREKMVESKERRGVLILPGVLVIEPEFRAAMAAIWSAEGHLPAFGGPGGPGGPPRSPPPPPVVPATPWLTAPWLAAPSVAPKLAALVVVLVLGSAFAFLVFLFWNPERPELAHGGLEMPPVLIEFVGQCTETIPELPATATTPSSAPPERSAAKGGGGAARGKLTDDDRRRLRLIGPSLPRGLQE